MSTYRNVHLRSTFFPRLHMRMIHQFFDKKKISKIRGETHNSILFDLNQKAAYILSKYLLITKEASHVWYFYVEKLLGISCVRTYIFKWPLLSGFLLLMYFFGLYLLRPKLWLKIKFQLGMWYFPSCRRA